MVKAWDVDEKEGRDFESYEQKDRRMPKKDWIKRRKSPGGIELQIGVTRLHPSWSVLGTREDQRDPDGRICTKHTSME